MNKAIDNTIRRPVFSTAVLQEQLIRCCCEEQPQLDTLRITSVEFLDLHEAQIGMLPENFDPPKFSLNQRLSSIKVTFNHPVDPKTVTTDTSDNQPHNQLVSFLVQRESTTAGELHTISGEVKIAENQVVFQPDIESRRIFTAGTYRVKLFGDTDEANQRPAIADLAGAHLDGEPLRLPSGNGVEGGSFEFRFVIEQPPID